MSLTEALFRKLNSIAVADEAFLMALEALPLRHEQVEKGREVARDGYLAEQCCLLTRGHMHRQKVLRDGSRQILALHFVGDIPDLQSLHIPRMDHSLVATTTCEVVFIPHEPLRKLIHQRPDLGDLLWRDSLIDASIFRTWIAVMGRQPAVDRMAHIMCEAFVRMAAVGLVEGSACSLPLTQEQLADALGLSIVHTNRSLQDLRERELLRFDGRRLTVLDWAGLRARAGFDPVYLHLRRRANFDPQRPIAA